jgi:hypothetical protein
MSYKNENSSAMLVVVISIIALTLVTAASFNHSYSALAVSKTKIGVTTTPIIGGESAQHLHETIISTPGQGEQQFYEHVN